jgi:DNA (cytosine-5)-methyltransferase 1
VSRPRLLDLFCGAGGAAEGYHRAGFEVVGVDIKPQPRFPFMFVQADAMTFPLDGFDAIHASPPCQGYTTMSNKHLGRKGEWPRLIREIRARMLLTGLPYVLENVEGAASEMRAPLRLHGGHFGLTVHRPRLFESNLLLLAPTGPHCLDPVGVYGKLDGRRLWTRRDGSEQRAPRTLAAASEAMGIDWMTWEELREAIPPAYTEFIGKQLRTLLPLAPAGVGPEAA